MSDVVRKWCGGCGKWVSPKEYDTVELRCHLCVLNASATKGGVPKWNCPAPLCDGILRGDKTKCVVCQNKILNDRYGPEIPPGGVIVGTDGEGRFITEMPDKQSFPTGAVRDTEDGKDQVDLVPPFFIRRFARHLMKGARKYGTNNYQKGIPSSRCYRSMYRHLLDLKDGDLTEDNLSAIAFGCLTIMSNQKYHKDNPEINDMRTWDPDVDDDYAI